MHKKSHQDMNLNEFATSFIKIYLIYKNYQQFTKIEHIQFTQSTYSNMFNLPHTNRFFLDAFSFLITSFFHLSRTNHTALG